MKRRDLEKKLKKNGWTLKRHGGDHDIWEKDGKAESIPRTREVNEITARKIIERQGLK